MKSCSARICPTALLGVSLALGLAVCPQMAKANVYPSGVSISSASFNSGDQTTTITYILNENADGTDTLPGVKIEVLDSGNTAVRTAIIARQKRGSHQFEWDGRNDAGAPVAAANYTVKITAADYGYTSWTKISIDQTSTSFEYPFGVSVNQNPASAHYGKIYVSNSRVGSTVFGRACADAVYVLAADTTDLGNFTGGVSWTGDSAPFRSMIGEDDRLYVADLSNDLCFEFDPDTMTATQLITPANRTANQWVHSPWVTGTKAAGNRKLYLMNGNYNDLARKGVIGYDLGSAATATPSDTGFQVIGPDYFVYYGYDFARDALGNWYLNNYRASAGQASPLAKFIDNPLSYPLNTPAWEVSSAYTYSYCVGYCEAKKWALFGNNSTGYVRIFDRDTAALLYEWDAGGAMRDLAFDAANNLYTIDNSAEWLRVWSPPDGPNSKDVSRAVGVAVQGTGGPVISSHPADMAICPGDPASFSVAATGGTLTYQWKKNGAALTDSGDVSGATTATLSLTNVQVGDDGAVFTCVVTDENGIAASNPAVLTVGLVWEQSPLSTQVCQGTNPVFTANVTLGSATYQWQRTYPPATDFVNIDGETSTSVTLTNVQFATDNGAQIRCVATGPGACGTSNSSAATLTISTGPTTGTPIYGYIYGDPPYVSGGRTICEIAVVSSTGSPTFQWKANGSPISDGVYNFGTVSGSTTGSILITALKCNYTTQISVVVSDQCGSDTEKLVGARYVTGYPVTPITVGGSGVPEQCGNGDDDDCDTLIDCDDPDCDLSPLCIPPCNSPFADADDDGDVDMDDFGAFQLCFTGPTGDGFDRGTCHCFDRDANSAVDAGIDLADFMACASGADVPADEGCDDFASGNVVINEVQYDDYNVADSMEFVELYNRDANPVNISGWLLRAPTMAGRDVLIPGTPGIGSTIIPGNGYYVIGSPSVPLVNVTISPSTDFWENDREALELVDANGTVKDTVVYERYAGEVAGLTAPEGGIWGTFVSTSVALQSLSRWIDGEDTDSNGRDFGLRVATPGETNNGPVVAAYAPPNVDGEGNGAQVSGLTGSFVHALVIDPADTTLMLGADDVNPNVIPVSPQGGKAIIAWDPSGGGNLVVSNEIMTGNGSYDLWVYLDTSDITVAGAETTAYGLMGTADPLFNTPDPGGTLFVATTNNPNGCTGIAWIFQKDNAGNVKRLFLVDAGPGGNSTPDVTPMNWVVHQAIDMSAVASGWYRLSIAYTGATGAVQAKFGAQTYNFNTAAGLKGGFYIGYRESLDGTPASLRPPTFDKVQ